MKIINVLTVFIIFYSSGLKAQVTQEWVATYNGTGTGGNIPVKNAIDNSGNLIVAGRQESGSTDYLILKYNTSGILLWSRTYDGVNHNTDRLRDMILDDSGNVYVTGSSNEGASNGYFNWLTIKYSSDGNLVWKKSLDWTLHKEDVPFSITLDKDRNVFVAGYGWAPPDGIENFDMVVAKYNNNGDELWTRSYDSAPFYSDWGYSVQTDDSGCAYVSGYSYPAKTITIKYDGEGNQKWIREYNRMSGEYAIPLFSKIDKQNNIIVNAFYEVSGQYNFVTLKYDRNGKLLWDRVFDSPEGQNDVANDIFVDKNSNVYVAGRTQSTTTFNDALVIKYSPDGDTLWIRKYDDGIGQHDEANSIAVDSLENVYLTGRTFNFNTGDDFLTLKYNLNGYLEWNKKLTLPQENIAYSISSDKSSNIFISGFNDISSTYSVLISVKYSELTKIGKSENIEINNIHLNNFPNPFNTSTLISYNLIKESNIILNIFDVNGRQIKMLINSLQIAGNYKINFEGDNLPSGIYFYSLFFNGNLIDTKRMLLIKYTPKIYAKNHKCIYIIYNILFNNYESTSNTGMGGDL